VERCLCDASFLLRGQVLRKQRAFKSFGEHESVILRTQQSAYRCVTLYDDLRLVRRVVPIAGAVISCATVVDQASWTHPQPPQRLPQLSINRQQNYAPKARLYRTPPK